MKEDTWYKLFFISSISIMVLSIAFVICAAMPGCAQPKKVEQPIWKQNRDLGYKLVVEEIDGYKVLIVCEDASVTDWGFAIILERPDWRDDFDTVPMEVNQAELVPPVVEIPDDND